MSEAQRLLTVLTPTYNRANELPRLVESLKKQTDQSFHWLVIDDGSTDDTEVYIKLIQDYGDLDVEYHKKKNGGKHTALNYAHPYIRGEFVMIVDSDDYLTPDAVETICKTIEEYKHNSHIACLSFQRGKETGEAIESDFPDYPIVSNHIDFRLNGRRLGDCAEVIRTSVFKEFPFPVFKDEKYMSEGYLWVNMSLKYDTVYFKKVVYICEYLEGGLTKSGKRMNIKYPYGGMANSDNFLKASLVKKLNLKLLIKETLLYIIYAKFARMTLFQMVKGCSRKGLMTLMYPFGVFLYHDWKRKYSE